MNGVRAAISAVNRRLLMSVAALASLVLLLAACKMPAPATAEPTAMNAQAVFTAAAQTAEAGLRQRQAQTATLPPEAILASGVPPTITPPPAALTPTLPAATTAAPPANAAPSGADKAEFVADVTVPDGTVFASGQAFQKTWRIRNAGQTTWNTGYALVYIDGTLMSADTVVFLTGEVAPGDTVDISVDMVAPTEAGNYKSFWKLKTPAGQLVGMQPDDGALWVDIAVQAGVAAATAVTTQAVTPTSSSGVTGVLLAVDNASATACPHTFTFTAQITLDRAATVTFFLEAVDREGSEIKVPLPDTRNLEAGVHPVVFPLTFAQKINGWARLRISEPAELFSNQVEFFLSCD